MYCISKHGKFQARQFHHYSLFNSWHSKDDFTEFLRYANHVQIQTLTCAKVQQTKISHGIMMVNLFPPNANPKISVIPKSFA
jgi:hypothetical protein